MDESHTVRVMSGHSAVLLHNNCIAGSDHLRRRRQSVYKLCDCRLARHRHIETSHMQSAKCVKRILCLLQRNIKSEISTVQTELLKTVILHGRGSGMSHRRTDQSI